MARNFETIFRIGGKIAASFPNSIRTASQGLENLQSRSERVKKSLGGIGAAANAGLKIAAVGAAALALPVKTAMDFEAVMSKVGAVSRAGADDLAKLTKQARDLGASTVWSASQAAEGMTFLAMAGFKTEDILGAMPGMLSLASAGGLELASAADIASNILTGFNMKASEMGRLADVMTNAFTQSNVSVEMLGETMKYVAPVAAGLGVSVEQTAAMAGKLGDAGIQASMAGTALRAIMGRLAAPPKMAADALDKIGVKAKDAAGNMRDVPTILAEIHKKTEKMGNADRSGIFKAIAGEEAFSALSVLTAQAGSGELQKFAKAMEEVGSAERVAKQMTDNANGAMSGFKSAVESVAITIGNALLPTITELLQRAAAMLLKWQQWADANPELVTKLVKIAAVVFGVIGAVSGLAIGIIALIGPFVLAQGAIMGVVGVVVKLFAGLRYLATAIPFIITIAKWLASGLWLKAIALIKGIASAVMFLGRVFLMNPIGLAITAIVVAIALIYYNWDTVSKFLVSSWEWVKSAWTASMSAISGLVSTTWTSIKAFFASGIANITATIVNFSPIGLFYQAFSAVMSYFGIDLPAKFTDFGRMMIQGLINGIGSMVGAVVEKAKAIAGAVTGAVKSAFQINSPSRLFEQFGAYNMQGLANGMDSNAGLPQRAANSAAYGAIPAMPSSNSSLAPAGSSGATLQVTQYITVSSGDAAEQAKKGAASGAQDMLTAYNEMKAREARLAF